MSSGALVTRSTRRYRSAQRIEQGWVYGRERDVAKKQHPCLVPYEFLSESEKNYDREMSKQTLTLLIAMGFDVVHAQMAEEEEEEEEEVRPSMRAIQYPVHQNGESDRQTDSPAVPAYGRDPIVPLVAQYEVSYHDETA